MGLLLKRELKSIFRKKSTWFFLLSIVLVTVVANLSMIIFRKWIYGTRDGTFSYNLIIFAEGFFWIPYYCSIFISDIAFGKKYPLPSDYWGQGDDRSTGGNGEPDSPTATQIYFSKLLTAFILLLIFAVFAAGAFLLLTPLMQIHDGTIDSYVIDDFLESVKNALPLFLAGISMANMFLFGTKQKKKAYLLFAVFVILLPRLIMFLATDRIRILPCVFASKYLITPQFQALQFFATRDVPKAYVTGLIYVLFSSAIGLSLYRRQCKET
ncbi:MAG: hypothetical protein K5989_01495 [Lachnospiraceae bacterium]|nr:hypothetical protein [Lachnospiraceae bacterium]